MFLKLDEQTTLELMDPFNLSIQLSFLDLTTQPPMRSSLGWCQSFSTTMSKALEKDFIARVYNRVPCTSSITQDRR